MTAQSSVNIAFKDFSKINENINKKTPTIPDKQIQDKDSQKIDATKLMIGATALAATIALGVYVARRGRFKAQNESMQKKLSQATETPQEPKVEVALPSNQEALKPMNNMVEETTENINKTETPSTTVQIEPQTQPKTDITSEKPLNSETAVVSKQTSETTPPTTTISKIQLSKKDIEIKTNMQNLIGMELSDDFYLKIINTPSEYTKNGRFNFDSLHNYTDDKIWGPERSNLFLHIQSVINNIKQRTPLEDEFLKILNLILEEKRFRGASDVNLKRWNTYNYLKKLYEENPNINFKNKEQIINAHDEMANSWLYRIKDYEISAQEKNCIMQNLLGFKQGIGYYDTPAEITDADYISAILSAARRYIKKPRNTHLEEIALDLAKKISPSYEEATKLAIENKYNAELNLLYRKGDNLMLDRPTKLYDEKTQKFVLNEYVICDDGCGHGAYLLNEILRKDGFENAQKYTQDVIRRLDTIIKESDKLDKDYVVYRALEFANDSEEWLPWKKVGNVITDKGFVSTAPRNGTYINMFGGRPGKNYILRIKLPKGTQGINMNNFDYLSNGKNNEYLLPRNSSFRVLGVDESTKVIDLEYLLPE